MSKPQKFRKKPVEIEAMRFEGNNARSHDVYLWIEENTGGSYDYRDTDEFG